jgi:predicted ferric reductase
MSEFVKKVVLLVVMFVSYFPIVFALTVEMPFAYHFSKTAAYIGFVTMWWAYVVGIRRLSGIFFRDYRWILKIHKWFNIVGLLIVLAHPISLIIGVYGIDILIPRISLNFSRGIVNYTNGVTAAIIATAILSVIWVTSALLKGRMSFRPWKFLHLLSYPLFFLIYYHIQIGFLQRLVPALAVYNTMLFVFYVCLITWQLLGRLGVGVAKYEVINVIARANGVVTLQLKPLGKGMLPNIGQYAYLQMRPAGESHPFSISGYNKETQVVEMTVKNLGSFSGALQGIAIGEKVFLDGPYGVFLQEAFVSRQPLVFLAGGIGVTPFISLLTELATLPELQDRSIYLIYGCKTRSDMAFNAELAELQTRFPKLHVTFVLDSDPEYEGEKGFITIDLINRHVYDELKDCEFFVCGPPVMIKKMEAMLSYIGIMPSRIHVELFG